MILVKAPLNRKHGSGALRGTTSRPQVCLALYDALELPR